MDSEASLFASLMQDISIFDGKVSEVIHKLELQWHWYEREIRVLGEEEKLPSLPVFRPPPPFARGLPEPSQEQT